MYGLLGFKQKVKLTSTELPLVAALTNKINALKECGLMEVCVASPLSDPLEEAGPSWVGVQWRSRPNSGNHR
jgi:hypothetical protein